LFVKAKSLTSLLLRCEESVSSYCGGRVEADSPGYLTSPGYPKYYLGGRECVWSLQAAAGQTISIQLLDVSTQVLINLFVLGMGRGGNTEYIFF
jgi:hypothetical protein